MKKILGTLLAFLYLSTSIGATIHLHYCMGRLISWGLIDHESKNCSTCGMEKEAGMSAGLSANKNCCKDEHKEIRTNKNQHTAPAQFQFSKGTHETAPVHFLSYPLLSVSSIALSNPKANSPPLPTKQSLFLLNRNFRI